MYIFLIFCLFICIIVLKNKCDNIENNLNEKIINLKERVKTLEEQKIFPNAPETEVYTNVSVSITEKEPERQAVSATCQTDNSEEMFVKEAPSVPTEDPIFESEHSSFNFEKFFMGNLFNKIGAIALIIGVGIFLKLVVWTSPEMKIISSFIIALAMLFISIKLHKDDVMKKYSEVLMGTSFAVLFITTYCGYTLYHILPVQLAAIIGILLVLATNVIAQKYNSFSTILIGLFGGYLNPFFINSSVSATFLFSYFIFVNIVGVAYILKNRDKSWVNCVNLLLTGIIVSVVSFFAHSEINIIMPFLLWGVYVVNDFLNPQGEMNKSDICLTWLNFGCLLLLVNYIFRFNNPLIIGSVLMGIALIYGIFSYFIRQKNQYISKVYTYNVLLSTGFAISCIDNVQIRFVCWLAEVLAIIYTAKKYNMNFMINWSIVFLIVASIQGCFTESAYLKVVCTALCALTSILLYKKFEVLSIKKWCFIFFVLPIFTILSVEDYVIKIALYALFALIFVFLSKKYDLEYIEKWNIAYLSMSFLSVLFDLASISNNDCQIFFNERTLKFAIPILSAVIIEKSFYKNNEIYKTVLKLLYVSFAYLWAGFEVLTALRKFDLDRRFVNALSLSIVGIVYAINMKQFYLNSKNILTLVAGYIVGLIALTVLITTGWNYSPLDSFMPVLNIRFFGFLLAMGTCIFFSQKEENWKKDFFQYLSAFIGAILVHCETKDYLLSNGLGLNIILSSAWLVYAGILMFIGIFKDIKAFKITGIWITIISVLKIVFFDLANIETVYKLIEFLILGAILLVVSYYYTKNIKR